MTALALAVVLVPLAAAPLPAGLRRIAGLDPAWPALGAALATLALALALLPAALSGAAPLVQWRWVGALGLQLALRADGPAVGIALALAAGSVLALGAARWQPRAVAATPCYGRTLALTGTLLGAALAADLALLWFWLELASLASVLLIAGDRAEAPRRRAALAALVILEAGGLALLAGVLLVADAAGSFLLDAARAAGAELRAQPLYLPMAGLVLTGAATRLAPWLVAAGRPGGALAAGAGLAAALLVALRFAPVLGGTRAWLVLLAVLGAGAALLVAWRASRTRGAGPAHGAVTAPALLEEFALAARLVWQPLAAPRLALSLAALAVGAAGAVALGAAGARPAAWPAPLSPAWPVAAGSAWLLLAVAACVAAQRAARMLALAASTALLLLAAFAPPAIVGAELVAGAAALWLAGRAVGAARPGRATLLALGACLATAMALRVLVAGAPRPPGGDAGAAPGACWAVAPLALPLVAAAALFALGRAAPWLRRSLAGCALVANLALAAGLLLRLDSGPAVGLVLGAGPAPFGIHLLLDRFAALLLAIAAVVTTLVYGQALGSGAERRHRHFHALCQLQLAGLAGAVLAADLVDLFVFLELALLAFNRLLAQATAGQPAAARAHVAVAGAAGSGLYLIAAGCVYASLGTLGFAELAIAAPAVVAGAAPLLDVGAYLLLIVLALRTGALPFGFWLTCACEAAPAVAAFAVLLAEVGVYAILRIYALVFPCFGVGPCGPSGLVLPLGLATLAGGGVGALAATGSAGLRAPLLAVALGTLLVGAGSFREPGFAAAIYLFAPAAIGAVALAFVGAPGRGAPGGAVARHALGAAGLLAALGSPPFAAWVGRIGILAASGPDALVVWSLVLVTALIAATAAARAARAASATSAHAAKAPGRAARRQRAGAAAAGSALALAAALAAAAGPLYELAGRAARQLLDRQSYVAAFARVAPDPR